MGGDPGKVIKNMKGAAQKYLGVGFLLGFFLVLLTYFTVSEQFAITAPNGESVLLFFAPRIALASVSFVCLQPIISKCNSAEMFSPCCF
jgi:hypothetical protein